MSLPLKAIDRLFDRLTTTYGTEFTARYAGIDEAAVKTSWAHELSIFGNNLQALAWALENLPERAPNAIQFKALARQAPSPETPRLPLPKADPERVKRELAKLAPAMAAVRASAGAPVDPKAWAHRIVARVDAGEKLSPTVVLFAKQALGLDGQGNVKEAA